MRREPFFHLTGTPRATVLKRILIAALPELPRPGLGGKTEKGKTIKSSSVSRHMCSHLHPERLGQAAIGWMLSP